MVSDRPSLPTLALGRPHPEPEVQALPGAAGEQRPGVWLPAGATEVLRPALGHHQRPAEPVVLTLPPCYCVAPAAMSCRLLFMVGGSFGIWGSQVSVTPPHPTKRAFYFLCDFHEVSRKMQNDG